MLTTEAVAWPTKHSLLGVRISATTYDEAIAAIVHAVECRERAVVSLHAVHALVTASRDRMLREAVNEFEIVAPDGQPVRWALNRIHDTQLADRVYGPELMLRLCERAAEKEISIYLYGSSPEVLETLSCELTRRYPRLIISGTESPPFRPLTAEEDEAAVKRIHESGAGIVFIGLGAPKQDLFAHEHRSRIDAVQVCVGAAFDFHAGMLSMAPAWMQRSGLEWLFRLIQEPGRLWKRYFFTNSIFLWGLGGEFLRRRLAPLFYRSRHSRVKG